MDKTNNFDYTSIPGDLLYCDRRKLDDFDVEKTSSLNYYIYERLYDRFSHFENYEEFTKDIFNCAYYICTMAFIDSHPDRRFGNYRRTADHQMHYRPEYSGIVLAIVYCIISGSDCNITKEIDRLLMAIRKEIYKDEYGDIYQSFYLYLLGLMENPIDCPQVSEFSPRLLNCSILKNSLKHGDWISPLGKDEEKTLELIYALGKTEDEQNMIARFLSEQNFMAFDNGAEHKFFNEYIERQIYLHFHGEEERAKIEAEWEEDWEEEMQKEIEADYNKERVVFLEAENSKLRQEIVKMKNDIDNYTSSDTTSNINKQFQEKDEEIQKLKEELEVYLQEPISDIPHDKVRLEVLCKLLEESDVKYDVHGVKAEAARLAQYITGLPASTCRNYMTNRDLNTTKHREEVLRTNTSIKKLGIKWQL